MAPFLVDPVSTFTLPTKRKNKTKTSYVTHHNNSGGNTKLALAIVGGVLALILILLIVGWILKRRKAKGVSASSGGYSADASGDLYGGTPGVSAIGSKEQEFKHDMPGNGSDPGSGSVYSTSSGGGHHGGETAVVQGEAAAYHYPPQGYGGYSQNPYQRDMYDRPESYEKPQQPSRALIPPRAHASFI